MIDTKYSGAQINKTIAIFIIIVIFTIFKIYLDLTEGQIIRGLFIAQVIIDILYLISVSLLLIVTIKCEEDSDSPCCFIILMYLIGGSNLIMSFILFAELKGEIKAVYLGTSLASTVFTGMFNYYLVDIQT